MGYKVTGGEKRKGEYLRVLPAGVHESCDDEEEGCEGYGECYHECYKRC